MNIYLLQIHYLACNDAPSNKFSLDSPQVGQQFSITFFCSGPQGFSAGHPTGTVLIPKVSLEHVYS